MGGAAMCMRVCARRRAHDHDLTFSIQSLQTPRNLRFICPSIIKSMEGRLLPNGADAMTTPHQQHLDIFAEDIGPMPAAWQRSELGCYSVGGTHPLSTVRRGHQASRLACGGLSRTEIVRALGIPLHVLPMLDDRHDAPKNTHRAIHARRGMDTRLREPIAKADVPLQPKHPRRPVLSLSHATNRSNDHAGI